VRGDEAGPDDYDHDDECLWWRRPECACPRREDQEDDLGERPPLPPDLRRPPSTESTA
jgi:hypothetical protein